MTDGGQPLAGSSGPAAPPSRARRRSRRSIVPLVVAFALGVVLAKVLDWRSYAA